jgi:aspartate ammonia-lyase
MRIEHDFLGEMQVPDDVYYGVQTMRAIENFKITGAKLDPDFIKAIATVKKASCLTNMETGRMPRDIGEYIVAAADEIISGKLLDQFPLDPIQGGAGTSINMNMNEVLCNRALEMKGIARGRYDIISPNKPCQHGTVHQRCIPNFYQGLHSPQGSYP